jgi:myo-inositol 2-dehydrogenase/D-chiro-inositol 1-dehydrogenase
MGDIEATATTPVRLGLVGLGGHAGGMLDAIEASDDVTVVSVSDARRDLIDAAAERFSADGYADARTLIVGGNLDAVIMSLPHHVYPEFVRMAAEAGLHLLKEKPLARSMEEGLALVDAYRRAAPDKAFMLATQRRYHAGFATLKHRLAEAGRPFMVRSHFLFNWTKDFGWRGERQKAGFGCLGDAGYHNVDLLCWLFGPPQQVYSLQGGIGRPNPTHPYDTDDSGVAVFGYEDGLIGTIAASWAGAGHEGPPVDMIVHGTEGTLAASPDSFVRRVGGEEESADAVHVEPAEVAAATRRDLLTAFVEAVRSDKPGDCACSARENLINQAVVEAMYLSARTGQPQSPARIFEVHGRSIDDYLPSGGAA